MAKIKTFELDRWSEPDEKRRVRHIGMANAKETFDRLQTHLELKGLLPDEYFLFSDELTGELPEFDQALCIPNFGASEGIYLDVFLEWYEDSQRRTEHFMTGKTLGESGADMDRMSLISSAITKAFRGDNSVHARYMVVGGQSEPAETMSLNLSPDEQRLVAQALAEQRIRLGPQAEGEEKLLRRITGSVTEYMDAAGLVDRLDEHDRDLLAQHDGEQETAPVMGGMQL